MVKVSINTFSPQHRNLIYNYLLPIFRINFCNANQQPTWRLWGEERDKDAIYTVYLKKVRYHRPTPSVTNSVSHLKNLIKFSVKFNIYIHTTFF